MSFAQPLNATGHRVPGHGMVSLEERRRDAAMPRDDANANRTYFGGSKAPNAGAKPLGQKSSMTLNAGPKGRTFDASTLQRARRHK